MRSALVLLTLLTWSVPGTGQLPVPGPVPSVLLAHPEGRLPQPALAEVPRDSVRRQIRPTYWKEGGLIGGAVGVVGGAVLGYRLCGLSEELNKSCTGSVVAGGVGGAVLLAIPGALIGAQFSKRAPERDRPD